MFTKGSERKLWGSFFFILENKCEARLAADNWDMERAGRKEFE